MRFCTGQTPHARTRQSGLSPFLMSCLSIPWPRHPSPNHPKSVNHRPRFGAHPIRHLQLPLASCSASLECDWVRVGGGGGSCGWLGPLATQNYLARLVPSTTPGRLASTSRRPAAFISTGGATHFIQLDLADSVKPLVVRPIRPAKMGGGPANLLPTRFRGKSHSGHSAFIFRRDLSAGV